MEHHNTKSFAAFSKVRNNCAQQQRQLCHNAATSYKCKVQMGRWMTVILMQLFQLY